jgi:PAS domain S-box-containing protein
MDGEPPLIAGEIRPTSDPVRVLLVEDDADDAELLRRSFATAALDARVVHVGSLAEAQKALADGGWDVVVSDFSLRGSTGLDVLRAVRDVDHDLPFILVSGTIDDELAVSAMRAGAQDYVMKTNLTRLPHAVRRELIEAANRRARWLAEERNRVLVHCSLQGLLMVQDGRVVVSNEAAAEMLGGTREEILGLPVEELLERVSPEDRARLRRASCDGVGGVGHAAKLEARLVRADGPCRWVEVSSHVSSVGGRPAVQIALVDVTGRRERERELKAIATLATTLRSARSRREILQLLLDQVLEMLAVDGAAIASRTRSPGQIEFELARGVWSDSVAGSAAEAESLSGRVLVTGRSLVLDLESSAEGLARTGVAEQTRFVAGVPLIAEEEVLGALWIGRQRPIEEGDLGVLRAIADIAASALRRARLHEETRLQLRRLHALRAIDLAITTTRDLGLVFDVILEQVTTQLEVDAASILRVFDGDSLRAAAALGCPRLLDQAAVPIASAGLAGRAASSRGMVECTDLRAAGLETDRDRGLAADGFVGYTAVPLLVGGDLCGVLELLRCEASTADDEQRGFLETVAWQTAIAVDAAAMLDELRHTNLELVQAYDSTLEGWARALELRDRETEGHTRRVTEMTVELGGHFGFDAEELVNLRRGALLHDIGKLGIPDSILLKPGPLDEREWEVMRRHPTLAVQMLTQIPHLEAALTIPYGHHERWNGSGYPQALRGEDIPLAARIFAVVDVWDALASNRPYRPAWSHREIVDYLCRESGVQFDARVVEVFLEHVLPANLERREPTSAA